MIHTRAQVIQRATREFELLYSLVANLTDEQWELPVPRPETKDPWTVKDSLAHITHWKADVIRSAKGLRIPPEEQGLNETDGNRIIYMRWHERPQREVLRWHRQVQEQLLEALKEAPEQWFSKKQRREEWPFDLDGHSAHHRMKDIQQALNGKKG
jgi:uncharacterized damage-inducible protein DinB